MAAATTATAMFAQRLWRLLRRVLLWARKGGAVNRRLVADLRVVCNRLRSLRGGGRSSSMLRYDELHYRECELSFAETPTFQLKTFKSKFRRCIDPTVDSDDEEHYEHKYDDDDDENSDASYLEYDRENYECRSRREDGGVDRKADEFIAKFYRQVRLQRELSMQKRRQNSAKKPE